MINEILIIHSEYIFSLGLTTVLEKIFKDIPTKVSSSFSMDLLDNNRNTLLFMRYSEYILYFDYFKYLDFNIKIALIFEAADTYVETRGNTIVISEFLKTISKNELELMLNSIKSGNSYRQDNIQIELDKRKENLEIEYTSREQTIIELLLQGKTNKEIGRVLFLSEKTIRNNLTVIYKKLQVKSRREVFKKLK